MPGFPVVISDRGIPVVAVEKGAPLATIAENSMGTPIKIVDKNGTPLVIEGIAPPENLLDGLDWVAGASTTLSISDGKARATSSGDNPRIYKHVEGLTIGSTYRLQGNVYIGTASQVFIRTGLDASMDASSTYSKSWTEDTFVNDTFVATQTEYYVGPVGVTSSNGEYVEIDDDFSLSLV